MYSAPESTVGKVYSLKVPLFGKKTKTLLVVNSVPKTITDPEIIVVAKPVGVELAVGIAHSWKTLVDGSR
jgi:hypothetical protein